jgi:hypothetical protein
MNPKSVSIFACGGCGINIGRTFEAKFNEVKALEFSALPPSVYYIDTSDSNLRRHGIDQDRVFLFEGKDGGGKYRPENHSVIVKTMPNLLQKFEPSAFNIIVCSTGGGSGAVIGHVLLNELRRQNAAALVILIGSTASLAEIENGVKALRSLDKIAHDDNKPVVCSYLENSPEGGRSAVDAHALEELLALVGLFAGQHDELDSTDLKHWLTFRELGAELVALEMVRGQQAYANIKDVISVATLAVAGDNTHMTPTPAYQAVGYVPDSWVQSKFVTAGAPMSFCLSSDLVERASKELIEAELVVNKVVSTRVRRDSLVRRHDEATDDGQFL